MDVSATTEHAPIYLLWQTIAAVRITRCLPIKRTAQSDGMGALDEKCTQLNAHSVVLTPKFPSNQLLASRLGAETAWTR